MRTLPLDSGRCTLVSTGKYAEVAEWVDLSNGERKRSGNQATDANGTPMWVIDVMPDIEDEDRAEVIGVKVAMHEIPDLPKWRPVVFTNLVATVYVDRNSGRARVSMKADGIENLMNLRAEQKPKVA